MTYNEVVNIAKRLDKEIQQKIDKEVDERLEILKEGDLSEEELDKMSECLYISLVLQEYLNGEYEILEDEKNLLLEEMEEMYNEYGELLSKAKIEEKLSKKKRMALELMQIREQLFGYRDQYKDCNKKMKENRENNENFKKLTSKEKMREVAKENKKHKEKMEILGLGLTNVTPNKKDFKDQEARNDIQQVRNKVNEMEYARQREANNRKNDNTRNSVSGASKESPANRYVANSNQAVDAINPGIAPRDNSIINAPGYNRYPGKR